MDPERCPSFATAMKMGTPVFTPTLPSLADGLTVPTVGCNALATAGNFFTKPFFRETKIHSLILCDLTKKIISIPEMEINFQ